MAQGASVFGFSGSLDRISIRVQLFQKGIQTLDFDRFHQETVIDERPTKSRLDDVTFGWKQRVGQPENSNRRIFTLSGEDEFPDYLSSFKPQHEPEEKAEEPVKEYPCNDYVVFRRSKAARQPSKKSYVYIFTRLGPMDIEDPSSVELIARLTATDANRLTVEPALNEDEGILLETKFGDFTAKIKIGDSEEGVEDEKIEGKVRGSRKTRTSVSSIPEADHFVAARDGLIETVVNLCLVQGVDLLFDESLTIEHKLRMPAGVNLKSDNLTGRSQRYSADEDGVVHFGHLLEFVFESTHSNACPLLMIRIMAVDYWGRQYIAGYGCSYISLKPGRSRSEIKLWRPISHNALYEMFVGQAVDVDYFELQNHSTLRAGIDGQPSGTVVLNTTCVSQSRKYMARDILYQLKYGSKMADMGLRSDFYQRIMRVLMEFEEARSKLVLARAINRQKIKQ